MTKQNYTHLTNSELIGEVKQFNKGSRYIGRFIEHHQTELFVEIIRRTQFLSNATFTQRLYCIEHNITEIPKCKLQGCDNSVGWNGRTFCSHCCPAHSTLDPIVQQRTRKTNLEHNGSETYNNSSKAKQTKKEKYGDENYNNREQYLTTCNGRYGVDNPMLLDVVKNRVRESMLETQGVEWAMQSQTVRDKSKSTCCDKYGCEYVTQTDWFKEKCKNTCIEKYGVDNPSKAEEVKEKIQETMRERHGVDWAMQSQEIWNKAKETFRLRYPDGNIRSKSEQELGEFVKSIYNDEVILNCRTVLKDCHELDIYIPSKRLAIEFNGDYWHMNPRLYDESYYNSQSHCTAKEKWEYDKQKQEECESLGIKLIVVWEYDWTHSRTDVETMLQNEFTNNL